MLIKKALFLIFWFITMIIYAPSWQGGFYQDFCEFMLRQYNMGLWEYMLMPKYSLYQGVNLFHYTIIETFGNNRFLYFLLNTALHAGVAYSSYLFFKKFYYLLTKTSETLYPLLGSILFLVAPIVMENVIWKATNHYFTSGIIFFMILNLFMTFNIDGRKRFLIYGLVLYYISTYLLELFFVTPLIVAIILLIHWLKYPQNLKRVKEGMLYFLLPMLALFIVYYATFIAVIGNEVPRVDKVADDFFTIKNIFGRLGGITVRTFYSDFLLSRQYALMLHGGVLRWYSVVVIILVLAAIVIVPLIYFRKLTSTQQYTYAMLLMLLMSFGIIFPMGFVDYTQFTGLRYYYLSAIFWSQFLVIVLFILIKNKKIFKASIAIIALVMCSVVFRKSMDARRAFALVDDVLNEVTKWRNYDTIYVLGVPHNYNGMPSIGSERYPISNIRDMGVALKRDTVQGKIIELASFNMVKPTDGIGVTVLDSNNLFVQVAPGVDGVWFHHSLFGLMNQDNELFNVTTGEWGGYYLKLKQSINHERTVFVYYNNGQLKEVDWANMNQQQF